MKKLHLIFLWFIGIVFILTGTLKLTGLDSMSLEMFLRAHYPHWLLYLVGLSELSGGILILRSSTRIFGALLLTVVMIGAIATHVLLKDHILHMLVPVGLILFNIFLIRKAKK